MSVHCGECTVVSVQRGDWCTRVAVVSVHSSECTRVTGKLQSKNSQLWRNCRGSGEATMCGKSKTLA